MSPNRSNGNFTPLYSRNALTRFLTLEGFIQVLVLIVSVAGSVWLFSNSLNDKLDTLDEKIDKEIRDVSERLVRVETLLEELLGKKTKKGDG